VTKFRVVTEQPLGSGKTFGVFKCVTVCRRHCQLDDRGQFVVMFENKAILYCQLDDKGQFVVMFENKAIIYCIFYKLCFIESKIS